MSLAKKKLPYLEFVALLALLMSLVALAIDAILPAFPQMSASLALNNKNDIQYTISILFLGLGLGQLFYGPLSDAIGRKPAVMMGLAMFVSGAVLSAIANQLWLMLLGRFLQGFGLAGPRSVSLALIRDQYIGDHMAKVMSFIMIIFILVPALAPAFGQGILMLGNWRWIFVSFMLIAFILSIWFYLRQAETLQAGARIPFSLSNIISGVRVTCANRVAFGNTVTVGLISGAFLGYLSLSQPILQEAYQLGEQFPLYFAILALSIGAASYFNSRLVLRYGTKRMCFWSLLVILSSALLLFSYLLYFEIGLPKLFLLMAYLMLTLFCVGILFGNLNAMAMEPLGDMAGIGAAVVGSLSTLICIVLGIVIGQFYAGTIMPMVLGFLLLAVFSLLTQIWTYHPSRFSKSTA